MPIFLSRQHHSHLYVWLLKDLLGLGDLGGGYSVANRLVVLALEIEDDGDEEQRRESHPDEDWHIVKAVAATSVSRVNDHRGGGTALTEAPAGVPELGRAIDQRIPGPASCAPLPSAAPDKHRSPIQDLSCEGQFMAWCGCWREKQRPEPICSLWCHLSSLPDDFLGILRWVSRGLDRESAGMLCCVPRDLGSCMRRSRSSAGRHAVHRTPRYVIVTLIPVIPVLGNKSKGNKRHCKESEQKTNLPRRSAQLCKIIP